MTQINLSVDPANSPALIPFAPGRPAAGANSVY